MSRNTLTTAEPKKYIEVIAIVEGKTEQVFIESILRPYLANKQIYISATQVSKSGQKGGDVKFSRVKKDLAIHLKQRSDTYVTTFVDYYGIKEWPAVDTLAVNLTPVQISESVNKATTKQVIELFAEQQAKRRFIPYIAMHEFEALLFSDTAILANELAINQQDIDDVLEQCGEPEAVNNSPQTAPSKRLDAWYVYNKFPKTTAGIAVAKRIGITKMREQCPVFNAWINSLEGLLI